jgi:hypothetical protein
MQVRFLKDAVLSDGFTPTQYKEGEVHDLSDLNLAFVLKNDVAVPVSEPSEKKVVAPSQSKVTRPSSRK